MLIVQLSRRCLTWLYTLSQWVFDVGMSIVQLSLGVFDVVVYFISVSVGV